MKKYSCMVSQIRSIKPEIKTVEIERETNSSVWINGSRRSKRSGWVSYYDSFGEAKKALISCQSSINQNVAKRLEEGIEILKQTMQLEEGE